MNKERSVGFINYKINISEKQLLESTFKKMIISKSIDFLETPKPVEKKKFRKHSKEIKDIKMQWKEKIKDTRRRHIQIRKSHVSKKSQQSSIF